MPTSIPRDTRDTRYPRHGAWHRAGARRPGAGILARYTDPLEAGPDAHWWLLGLRAPELGGAWANLGGTIDHGESAADAAMREFTEEAGLHLPDYLPAHTPGTRTVTALPTGTPTRPYTMLVVDVTACFDDATIGWEHDDLAWFTTTAVNELAADHNLHTPFAHAWTLIPAHLKADLT